MMRYFYSICFLVLGTGLPVLAKSKGTDYPTPSTSSKAGSKGIPFSSAKPESSVATEQIHKKAEIIVTPDITRGEVSSSLLSKQQEPAATVRTPARTVSEASPAPARNTTTMTYSSDASPVRTESGPVTTASGPVTTASNSDLNSHAETRLARVTAYWAGEGDYYTGRGISATGVRLHDGHCAVDPNIIPYGSVVEIAGVGKYLAVDTGSAVISRTAAREGGHTDAERHAIVVDVFFEDSSEGEKFAAGDAKYVSITWWTPTSMGVEAKAARSLFAEENWTKIQSKQL